MIDRIVGRDGERTGRLAHRQPVARDGNGIAAGGDRNAGLWSQHLAGDVGLLERIPGFAMEPTANMTRTTAAKMSLASKHVATAGMVADMAIADGRFMRLGAECDQGREDSRE